MVYWPFQDIFLSFHAELTELCHKSENNGNFSHYYCAVVVVPAVVICGSYLQFEFSHFTTFYCQKESNVLCIYYGAQWQ